MRNDIDQCFFSPWEISPTINFSSHSIRPGKKSWRKKRKIELIAASIGRNYSQEMHN